MYDHDEVAALEQFILEYWDTPDTEDDEIALQRAEDKRGDLPARPIPRS